MSAAPLTPDAAVRAKLQESLGPVFFSDLQATLARDAVFVVGASVVLLDCAVAIALDDAERVKAWIDAGELRKPSRAERERWPNEPEHTWLSVVVQPFALIQELAPTIEAPIA